MHDGEKRLYLLLGVIITAFILTGLLLQGPRAALRGLLIVQYHPARLINDFTLIGGTGAALINCALVGALGLALVGMNRIRLSGPTFAAVFTMMGFGLFGKTPVNCIPIILGVFLAARLIGKSFKEYILIALFGTALGPLVTFIIREAGFTGVVAIGAGIAGGVLTGFILPSLAVVMLRLHQGYNLYNMGFTCGFLGLFAAAVFHAAGRLSVADLIWNREPDPVLIALVPVLSILFLVWGFVIGGRGSFQDYIKILKLSGRLPSDFMDMTSAAGTLVNTGSLGLLCWIYVIAVGGDLNGPVLGGIFTVIGFSAFGKHLGNCLPVGLGVVLAAAVFGKPLSDPVPLLAALFGTTLAPVAGEFGPAGGIIAGFLHLVMVDRTGAWHGGLDLYNNGFSGGLTATLVIAVIEWFRSNRPQGFGIINRLFKKRSGIDETKGVSPPPDR